jgi:hypothetical protein
MKLGVYLSQDISELRWPLQIHTLVARQPRYGERGEAIALAASCSPLALSIFNSPLTLKQPRLADILRPVYAVEILLLDSEPERCIRSCDNFRARFKTYFRLYLQLSDLLNYSKLLVFSLQVSKRLHFDYSCGFNFFFKLLKVELVWVFVWPTKLWSYHQVTDMS